MINPNKPCLCCGQFPQAAIRHGEGVCESCAFYIDEQATEATPAACASQRPAAPIRWALDG